MRKRKRESGGEQIFFSAREADVKCLICFDVMHDPCVLGCACGLSFCEKCLLNMPGEETVTCPHCNAVVPRESVMPCCKQWRDVLDAIPRRCPNDSACRYKRGNYAETLQHATRECVHREERCPNEECGQTVRVKNMKEHLRLCRGKRCKNFISPKYGCLEMGTQKEIEAHEARCPVSQDIVAQLKHLLKSRKGGPHLSKAVHQS